MLRFVYLASTFLFALFFASATHAGEFVLTAKINSTKPNDKLMTIPWDRFASRRPEVFVSIDGGDFQEMVYKWISSSGTSGFVYEYAIPGEEFPKSIVFIDDDLTDTGSDPIGEGQCKPDGEYCNIIHPTGKSSGIFKIESGGSIVRGTMETVADAISGIDSGVNVANLIKETAVFKLSRSPDSFLKVVAELMSIKKDSALYVPAQCALKGLDFVTRDHKAMAEMAMVTGVNVLAALEVNSSINYSMYHSCSQSAGGRNPDVWESLSCDKFVDDIEGRYGCAFGSSCEKKIDQKLKDFNAYSQLSRSMTKDFLKGDCKP